MAKLNIPIILGTDRKKRHSIHAANFILEVSKEIDEIETFLVDPAEFDFKYDGNDPENKDPKYTEVVEKADGFVIVTPEYNHSFPGALKTLMDTELRNYVHKPVVVAGVSDGPWGGVRVIEALSPVLREYGLYMSFADLHFPMVKELFDDKGKIQSDKKEKFEERVNRSFTELIWLANTLKWGRENLENKYHE